MDFEKTSAERIANGIDLRTTAFSLLLELAVTAEAPDEPDTQPPHTRAASPRVQ